MGDWLYSSIYSDYFPTLGFYLVLCGFVSLVLAAVSVFFSFSPLGVGDELGSPYECGFLPFDRSRTRFDVNFFVVGLLFLLFDLEVVFLLPWCLVVHQLSWVGFGGGFFFFLLLGVAFFYELTVEALTF